MRSSRKPLRTIDVLAAQVCRAVRDVRHERQAWVALESLQSRIGDASQTSIDAAVAFAAAKGWLSISSQHVLLRPAAPFG